MSHEQRVLIFAPFGRDGTLISQTLQAANHVCGECRSWKQLACDLEDGAATVILSEEALALDGAESFHRFLADQPAWADLPVLLLTSRGADSPAIRQAMRDIGNVTLLERPLRIAALSSAVRTATRSRARQYQSRTQLQQLQAGALALGASEQRLREADVRKDEFLATLAHELRNPLAPIRNALHMFRRRMRDPDLVPLQEIVERQLAQLIRLVDDLLEISRITRGKIDLQVAVVDMGSVIRSAIETSRPVIDSAGHKLVVNVPAKAPLVRGDSIRLAQVFSNLLNNAAKYTEDGGVVTVDVGAHGDHVEVIITDTGIGIAPELVPTIFEMFAQIRGSTDRAQGGLGIGLTLVKRLVEMHGGAVTAESAGVGKGSSFRVRLPAAVANTSTDPQATVLADCPLLPREIIIVDDNRDAADTLAMVLRAHGATVRVMYSANEVLATLEPESETIVLADLGMPLMSGYELARKIRADPGLRRIRLVAVSGWGDRHDRELSRAAGFEAHLTKPADIAALTTVLAMFS
jgi:two-component system, sensor histidine kinase